MTKEEKYKETKICPCICCGTPVTVTKFASASKVICDKCKQSGAQPSPSIQIAQPKKIESHSMYGGDTKECPCIQCGEMVTVTKFATPSKVLCPNCKGDTVGCVTEHRELDANIKIDMKKLDRSVVPVLEEYIATSALISNVKLRNIVCPACGHEHMRILRILDWSSFGLIISYQCPKCKLLIQLSEQTKETLKTMNEGTFYDYSGDAIESVGISAIDGSRMSTTVQRLMKILKDNNIEIEGEELPPYVWENKRPVPVGYRIPRDDESIKIIDDTINILDKTERQGLLLDSPEGARYITISDTLAKQMSDKLKKLFKDGDINE